MKRILREHPEPFHQVILSCEDNIVSIQSRGKTRSFPVEYRPDYVWIALCNQMEGMNPKQALHVFDLKCHMLSHCSKRDLGYIVKNILEREKLGSAF